jgi:hypothetical protein
MRTATAPRTSRRRETRGRPLSPCESATGRDGISMMGSWGRNLRRGPGRVSTSRRLFRRGSIGGVARRTTKKRGRGIRGTTRNTTETASGELWRAEVEIQNTNGFVSFETAARAGFVAHPERPCPRESPQYARPTPTRRRVAFRAVSARFRGFRGHAFSVARDATPPSKRQADRSSRPGAPARTTK